MGVQFELRLPPPNVNTLNMKYYLRTPVFTPSYGDGGVVAERLTPPSSDQNVHGSSLAVALFVYTENFASLCSLQPVLQMIEKFLLFGWVIGMAFSLSRFRGFVAQKSQLVGKSIQMATGDRLLG